MGFTSSDFVFPVCNSLTSSSGALNGSSGAEMRSRVTPVGQLAFAHGNNHCCWCAVGVEPPLGCCGILEGQDLVSPSLSLLAAPCRACLLFPTSTRVLMLLPPPEITSLVSPEALL